jgi:hypothetical protein
MTESEIDSYLLLKYAIAQLRDLEYLLLKYTIAQLRDLGSSP